MWHESTGRPAEDLGRPEHDLEFVPGTRTVKRATLRFTEPDGSPLRCRVEPLLPLHVGIGTGYGHDADWRHGMYQGPLKVEGLMLDLDDPDDAAADVWAWSTRSPASRSTASSATGCSSTW